MTINIILFCSIGATFASLDENLSLRKKSVHRIVDCSLCRYIRNLAKKLG